MSDELIKITPTEPGAAQRLVNAAKSLEAEYPGQSRAIALLSNAVVQLELMIKKADEALEQLNMNLNQINTQKVGLVAQKTMVAELKERLIDVDRFEHPKTEEA